MQQHWRDTTTLLQLTLIGIIQQMELKGILSLSGSTLKICQEFNLVMFFFARV